MSMGAINALAYAVNHSDRLSHLVIIDAGPEMRRPGSSRIRDFVNDVADAVSIEAIIERALQFNPRRDPKILRRSLMHNLRQQPDGSWRWKYDRSRFQRLNQDDAPRRAGALGRRARRRSPVRLWSCAAARATYFTTRTPSALPRGCRTAAGSRSRAPVTPCRATTRRASSPNCAAFWRRGIDAAEAEYRSAIPADAPRIVFVPRRSSRRATPRSCCA